MIRPLARPPLRCLLWALVMAAVVLTAVPASAKPKDHRAAAVAVTLEASASQVAAGRAVRLSGSIDPAAAGETVEIRDDADALVATLATGAAGGFHVDVIPPVTTTYHAEWSGLDSEGVPVGVRAVISGVSVTNVLLFDTARVAGTVSPARPGEHVTVQLIRKGRTVASRHPAMGAAGRFVGRFPIRDVGTYRVRARFDAADLAAGVHTTKPRTTPLPDLHEGSRSSFVTLLEQRLRALHYHLTPADRRFDLRTSDAVMAFRKVQRMARNHAVTDALWRALARPRPFTPRSRADGFHIEIDQTRQVVVTVLDGHVQGIIHTSTGKPSTPTYDGTFTVNRKIAGYSPHLLYYPSYFDGNRAIHGWPEVPSYAASHGCARVPYWTARWIYGVATIGTRVIVYHS
jgi:hypothetical protein